MRVKMAIGVWISCLLMGCYSMPAPEPATAPGDTLGVTISFSSSRTIFPSHWLSPPISAKVERLKPEEEERSKKAVAKAITKYPRRVIRDNLTTVYVLRSLNFYNVGFGATYYENKLYLANDGVLMGYNDRFLEQSFHHEFSSVLYFGHKSDFDTDSWNYCNPPGFAYNDEATGGVEALRNNEDGTDFDAYYNAQGFIDQYSQSSMENDINELAQQLFMPDEEFWPAVKKHRRLERKVMQLILFYHKIDPQFTYEYFKKFDQAAN